MFEYLFTLNLLVSVLSIFLLLLLKFQQGSFQDLLKLNYFLLTSIFLAPFGANLFPKNTSISSQRLWNEIPPQLELMNQVSIKPSIAINKQSFDFIYIFYAILILGVIFGILKLLKNILQIRNIIKSACLIRSYKSVRILVSDEITVPFAFWIPFRHYVVLSENILLNSSFKSLALAHELQHHRQGDTKWVYVLQFLKIICIFNPFVYLLETSLSELQEFACDEVLIGRQNTLSSAYSRCLLWVAEKSLHSSQPLGSLNMLEGGAKKFLSRRINLIFKTKQQNFSRLPLSVFGVLGLSLFLSLAHTASAFQTQSVSLKDAQAMLENAKKDTEFPIVVNELVLERLNYYLGTEEGRSYMRGSLERMKTYKDTVNSAIESYGLPYELAAIPIVESGYRNSPQKDHSLGAGLWMFIQETARNFGLQVNSNLDQRLDTVVETDAAMRLLGALKYQFQDWGLALLAYNAGSEKVLKGLKDPKIKSRYVWDLIRGGYDGDPYYMASVFAAILIMKNPSYLDK